ncbi:MAG TPA: shikimate dehydrogenase [Acidimicrobiales bacterium]|nr:shikimate dehydrogenase [Acidimicrobiales bacterium]
MISGATRVAALIGWPARHSLSPAILNAAFAATGADWVFTVFEVPAGRGEAAVGAARTLGLGGLSVTMPHKAAAWAAVDERTPAAEDLGAVNCVYWRGDVLCGDNTDGRGLLDALRIDEGVDPDGARCVVLGAGGAGRAVARALGGAGASEVVVVNRSPAPAERAAALAGPAGKVGDATAVAHADIVVNATPLGMGVVVGVDGQPEPLPVDPDLLTSGQIVVDLIYHPPITPLLAAARDRGIDAVNGLGMLIHQAAQAFRHWTNEEPALEAMSAAALAELTRRSVAERS